jgi:hypothetical protein
MACDDVPSGARLRGDLLRIFRQHAEHVGGEDVIAKFLPFLRLLLGEIGQALAPSGTFLDSCFPVARAVVSGERCEVSGPLSEKY